MQLRRQRATFPLAHRDHVARGTFHNGFDVGPLHGVPVTAIYGRQHVRMPGDEGQIYRAFQLQLLLELLGGG